MSAARVSACVCAGVAFETLRPRMAAARRAHEVMTLEAFLATDPVGQTCGRGCTRCRPYLAILWQTGQTQIPLQPSAP